MADQHSLPLMGPDSPAGHSPSRDDLALARTYMAAMRTLFALLRTGSVIAGGGALVTNLLVKNWPQWMVVTISSVFVILGYSLMWLALRKSRQLREQLKPEASGHGFLFPLREVTIITWGLQILIAAVVALFLFHP